MDRIQTEPSVTSKLMNIDTWKTKVAELTSIKDPTDIEYVTRYLSSRKCILVDKVGSEEVIMMGAVGTYPKISVVEKGKYDISRTKEILEKQLEGITEKKVAAEEKARANLKQGLRTAVSCTVIILCLCIMSIHVKVKLITAHKILHVLGKA